MRLRNSFLAACALLSACRQRAAETNVFVDPQFAVLVPPDTTLLVGTRVEQLVKTPIYQKYLRGRIQAMERFGRGTGIDIDKSMWNMLLVSSGRRSFVLGRGKFADELMAPDFSKRGVERFGYRGLTMFGDARQAMLLINSSTIAMGDTALLRSLVDQRPMLKGLPPRLASLTKEIPRQTQFWGAYAGGPVEVPFTGNLQNVNKVLSLVKSGTFYFDVSSGVIGTANGVATSAQDAQQVHDALEGFIGIGRMMAPKNRPEVARIFDGIRVSQEGQQVRLQIAEPEELAEEFLKLWLKQ